MIIPMKSIRPLIHTTIVSLLLVTVHAHADKTVIRPSVQATQTDADGQNNVLKGGATFAEDSLAVMRMPKESAFATANQQLLTENAKLEREVNNLQTQVDVLVNERSGQLFLYGVFTAFASFFLGGFLSWMFFSRRKRW